MNYLFQQSFICIVQENLTAFKLHSRQFYLLLFTLTAYSYFFLAFYLFNWSNSFMIATDRIDTSKSLSKQVLQMLFSVIISYICLQLIKKEFCAPEIDIKSDVLES